MALVLAAAGAAAVWSGLSRSTPERAVENFLLSLTTRDATRLRAALCRQAREAMADDPETFNALLTSLPIPQGKSPSYTMERTWQEGDRATVLVTMEPGEPFRPKLELRCATILEDGAWRLDPMRTFEESAEALAAFAGPALRQMPPELRDSLPEELREPHEKERASGTPDP
ncbi:MAG: hypothetical protein ACE5R4_08555 [Armatimonadota bacterium]